MEKIIKKLKYGNLLPLKEMAFRRVAVYLWNDSEILTSIEDDLEFQERFYERNVRERETWETNVINKVVGKMRKLPLPTTLQTQILPILKAVGSELLTWRVYHEDYFSDTHEKLDIHILRELIWTSEGTVEYRKTAKALILLKVSNKEGKERYILDIVQRYILACLYCLEDFIPELWKELPEEYKVLYYSDEAPPRMPEPPLHFCWPYILKGEESRLNCMARRSFSTSLLSERIVSTRLRFYRYAFEHSAFTGNKTAAKYFFPKLTTEEREACLVQTVSAMLKNRDSHLRSDPLYLKEKFTDVLCYLLTLVTPEKLNKILKNHSSGVLSCFLDWPWQEYFSDIADVTWQFIPENQYKALLLSLCNILRKSGLYFPDVFQNFFLLSPLYFKRSFVDAPFIKSFFFEKFLECEDTKIIKIIFENIDAEERMGLVFSNDILHFFLRCIMRHRWPFVKTCLEEAMLSNENKQTLCKAFMGLGIIENREDPQWRELFNFLDERNLNLA